MMMLSLLMMSLPMSLLAAGGVVALMLFDVMFRRSPPANGCVAALPISEPPPEYEPETFPKPEEEPPVKPDPYQPASPIWGPAGKAANLLTVGPVTLLDGNRVVGSAVDVGRQWDKLKANGTTFALTDSEAAHDIGPRLRSEMSNVFCWPFTGSAESPLAVPSGTSRAVASADVVLVCPLSASDQPFAMQLLRLAKRSVLLLSEDQVRHRQDAVRLASHASCLILTSDAATKLTGEREGVSAIRWLRDHGTKNVVRLNQSSGEALAFVDRNWHFAPLFKLTQPARHDVADGEALFAATFVKFLAETNNASEALFMAQAALTLFHEASDAEPTQAALEKVRAERPFAVLRRAAETKAPRRRHWLKQVARPITAAASWLMALVTWSRVS